MTRLPTHSCLASEDRNRTKRGQRNLVDASQGQLQKRNSQHFCTCSLMKQRFAAIKSIKLVPSIHKPTERPWWTRGALSSTDLVSGRAWKCVQELYETNINRWYIDENVLIVLKQENRRWLLIRLQVCNFKTCVTFLFTIENLHNYVHTGNALYFYLFLKASLKLSSTDVWRQSHFPSSAFHVYIFDLKNVTTLSFFFVSIKLGLRHCVSICSGSMCNTFIQLRIQETTFSRLPKSNMMNESFSSTLPTL